MIENRHRIKSLLVPDERERRFLTEFKAKRYMPELLFEDTDILKRVKRASYGIAEDATECVNFFIFPPF